MVMRLNWWKNFRMGRKVAASPVSPLPLIHLFPGVYYRMELAPECQITHLGAGISDLLGYSAKELLNRNTLAYLRIAHPEHEEILLRKQMLCRQNRQTNKLEYHLFTKSRLAKLVEDHFIGEYDNAGHLIAIHGYFKEISKSPVKMQLLNQLEAYRAAIDVNIICSITDTNGKIIFANDNFKNVSQYSEEELLGKTHNIVRSGNHSRAFFEDMWKTITTGSLWRGEISNRAKDGSLYWVDTVIIPVFDERNKITSYLSLRMLITERKRAEEQKEKYIQVLENVAHVVAHDIRGPICSILGLVNLIEKTDRREQDLKPTLDYLAYASKKLDEITRDLSGKIYSVDQEMKKDHVTNETVNPIPGLS